MTKTNEVECSPQGGLPIASSSSKPRDYGKPIPYDSDFKGPMGKRSCTDCCCCLAFFVAIVGFVVIACYGFATGDPRRMVYPLDQHGAFCGIGNHSSRPYLYNPYLLTNQSAGDCVSACPLGTNNYLGRCLPFNATNPQFHELLGQVMGGWLNVLSRGVSDIMATWYLILIFLFVAMVLSFVWICLLRCLAGVLVWLSVLGAVIVLGAVTGVVWYQGYSKYQASISDPTHHSSTDAYLIFALAGVLTLLWVILLLVILAMCKRIRLAAQIIQETSRAVGSMVLIVFLPVWMFVCITIVGAFWLVGVLFVLSSGTITVNGAHRSFHISWPMRYLFIYCIFFGFWVMWFIRGLTQFTIAGAISTWYFTKADGKGKKHVPGHPILRSFHWGIRYHMGSIAFGAAIIAIVALIRTLLAWTQKKLKNSQNKCAQFCLSCLQCCMWCFQKILEYISKTAYIMMAIHSKNFCRSAKDAFCLLMRNILRMAAVNSVGDLVIYLGKIFIVSLCAGFSMIAINPSWVSKSLERMLPTFTVSYWWIPVLIIALVSFLIASVFLSVYSFGIDTILLCFCEDIERHKDMGREFTYASPELQKYMSEVRELSAKEKRDFDQARQNQGGQNQHEMQGQALPSYQNPSV